MLKRALLIATPVLLATATLAHADTIGTTATFSLTEGCASTIGGGASCGTIQLTQTTANTVTVTETLASGVRFAGTGAGGALEFNLTGSPTITIANITSGFEVGLSPEKASTFGTFDYSVTCDYNGGACHGGQQTNSTGPLSFTVTDAAGVSVSSFIANPRGYFFASDLADVSTGNVATLGATPVSATPEPASLSLLGTGALALAAALRRRRQQQQA